MGAALRKEGGRRDPHEPLPPLPTYLSACTDKSRTPALISGLTFAPKSCCLRRPPPDLPAPVTSERHQPAVPAQSSTVLGQLQPPQRLWPTRCPLSGARFSAASRCQNAGCPDPPLRLPPSSSTSGSGGGSYGGGTPRALWEWRPAAPPSRQVETKRDAGGGGGCLETRGGLGGGSGAHLWSAAPHRSPPVQHLASASSGLAPPAFNSRGRGLGHSAV